MPSIFLGLVGTGGGVSPSFFLGIAYGPTSSPGPPASGGASCLFGFDCGLPDGCCDCSCATISTANTPKAANVISSNNLQRLRLYMVPNASSRRECPK